MRPFSRRTKWKITDQLRRKSEEARTKSRTRWQELGKKAYSLQILVQKYEFLELVWSNK